MYKTVWIARLVTSATKFFLETSYLNEITIENFIYLIMLTNIDVYIWVGLIGIAVWNALYSIM